MPLYDVISGASAADRGVNADTNSNIDIHPTGINAYSSGDSDLNHNTDDSITEPNRNGYIDALANATGNNQPTSFFFHNCHRDKHDYGYC